ncbi:MAG: acyltransferase [Lachnospiraceae bacterium]|nr:acyltransferase [Lachnospiraceae bacterium]
MKVINLMLKAAGKGDLRLDSRISMGYLIHLIWKYGWMMVRGKFFALAHKRISHSVFVGSKVKVLEKRMLAVGEKVKLHDGVYIDALSQEGVLLGQGVVLGRNSRIECTGGLQRIGKGIKIGDNSTFGNDCFFGAAGGIQIGNHVVAGQLIRFHSENHKYSDMDKLIQDQGVTHKGIRIGSNCWIGAGAVFLDGAEVGDGCVVAANTVITKQFPDNVVIGGVPAQIIKVRERKREFEE